MIDLRLRPNVLFFSRSRGEQYKERTTKFLADEIGWHFAPTDAAAFVEITKNTPGRWDLALVESYFARDPSVRQVLEAFVESNPAALIYIEGSPGEGRPADGFGEGTRFVDVPGDEDEWLAMMHNLIAQARSRDVTP